MRLQELTSEPVFMTAEEHARLQEATPLTFQGHAPVLRLKLDGVRCCIQPEEAISFLGETSQSGAAAQHNGSATNQSSVLEGTLWISEDQVSLLTLSGKGFCLDYPSLSLHAISRSLPSSLELASSSSLSNPPGCLYCQLEGIEDEDEDEQCIFPELWILPADQDSLEPLFEALSYCASLHPSATEEEDEGGGHPFSGVGPFGTGIMDRNEEQLASEGAFDDADEDQRDENVHLSETGRATLARLDSLIEDGTLMQSPIVSASSSLASFQSADARKAPGFSQEATNSLILVHLPDEIFTQPPLAASLLDLLYAYGNLASWTPLASFGRALIVYKEIQGAQRAKEALDRLVIPLVEEGTVEEINPDSFDIPIKQSAQAQGQNGDLALRAYFGPMTTVKSAQDDEIDHLAVPTTDRNFLISPPGSPPVGWEPIKEDPPNRDTLADDLIRALGSLRDKGLGVHSHQPRVLERNNDDAVQSNFVGALSAPSIFIPPRQATVESWHPLAKRASGENNTISLPGVMVQSVDDDDDDDQLDERMNKGLSISSVKATVESMKGAFVDDSSTKITPTSRPPLS